MQSQLRPGASAWWTWRNTTTSLTLPHWRHCLETWRHPQNRKYVMYCILVRQGPSHGHK